MKFLITLILFIFSVIAMAKTPNIDPNFLGFFTIGGLFLLFKFSSKSKSN